MEIARLKLKKLNNTRDLGGLPAAEGKTVRYGKLIRSGRLYNLPKETVNYLKGLGLKTVIDLRIDTELNEYPDTVIEGAEYICLPLLCTATPGITREKSMHKTMKMESKRIKSEFGNVDNYMIAMYKNILFNQQTQATLKAFLRLVIEGEGCTLWHCSGGKDRAGICAMLVESLLGVSDEIIVLDYVSSQRFQRKKYFWSKLGLYVAPVSRHFRGILFGMMNAKKKYIYATIRHLKENYGSVTEYCKQLLGVTDEDIALMKAKYLE